jgi:hypothetical protein
MIYPLKYHKESGSTKNDAANYIVELVSHRKAKVDGILLEDGYWKDAVWQKFYKEQKQTAHSLLGMFEESVVVCTVLEMKNVWSLRPKFVRDRIVQAAALKDKKKKHINNQINNQTKAQEAPTITPNEQTGKGRSRFNGKNKKDGNS